MPAEWAPHERCVVAWPGLHQVPDRKLAEARDAHAEVARKLSEFEAGLMLVYPGFGRQAEAAAGSTVDVLEVALGTVWMRDTGPIFAVRGGAEVVAVDFRFNSWGRTLPPYENSIGGRLCPRLGIERVSVPYVLEGGAFTVDGEGTLVAIEASILSDDRNPDSSRGELEGAFRRFLGVERTVWLEHGLLDDRTGGHADNVVAFAGPGRILCQVVPDDDPNAKRLAANRARLEEAGLEVVPFDVPPSPIRYLNFYLGNGCVLLPVAGNLNDRRAIDILREVFPDREVVGVPGLPLAAGGGGVHCITQQIPRP